MGMDFSVRPASFRSGTAEVPGDKSISHRALMLGSIATGRTEVTGFLAGEDCLATAAAMRALGVSIEQRSAAELVIDGVGRGTDHGHPVGLQAARELQRGLSAKLADHAPRLFLGVDLEDILHGERFEVELVGRIVVG